MVVMPWLTQSSEEGQAPGFPTFKSVTSLPQHFLREKVHAPRGQSFLCHAKAHSQVIGPDVSTWPRTANAEMVPQGLSEAQRLSHSQF